MKRIPLTQGKYAIVDDCDFEGVNQYKWYTYRHTGRPAHGIAMFYAVRKIKGGGKGRYSTSMHRQVLQAKRGQQIDHINHDGLDNRRENLRFCTSEQNNRNRRPRVGVSSAYKGVSREQEAALKEWRAQIRVNGKSVNLGQFDNEIDAAIAYDNKAKEAWGDFAYLNFPERFE